MSDKILEIATAVNHAISRSNVSDEQFFEGAAAGETRPENRRSAAPLGEVPPISQTGPEIEFEGEPPPSAFQLDVVTAGELCARPDPPRSADLLGPALRRGTRTIVGGATVTGDGKTTFCLHMISAAVRGTDFLGWQGHGGLRALVLDLEQGESSLKRALREAGLGDRDREDVDIIRVPDGLALDRNAEHVAELERVLERGGYDIVFIDPTYKAHSGDSNDEQHIVSLMRLLDGWRERFGFALLMATHSRKRQLGNGSFSIDDLFGSSAFVRGAEVVLGIQLVEEGASKLHFLKDRDGALPVRGTVWDLLFDREDGYRISDRPGAGEYVKASPTEIAEWIREQGGEAKPGEIREHFKFGDQALRNRRDALAELGIEYDDAGPKTVYRVVDDPARANPRHRGAEAVSFDDAALSPDPAPPAMDPARVTKSADEQGFSDPAPPRSLKGDTPAGRGVSDEDDPVQDELDYYRRRRDQAGEV